MAEVRVVLGAERDPETVLTVRYGALLCFELAATSPVLARAEPRLRTNVPADGAAFDRATFRELRCEGRELDERWVVEIVADSPGCFEYELVCEGGLPEGAAEESYSGYFTIQPSLQCAGKVMELGEVVCQTVLTKCLGPVERWEAVLATSAKLGYSAIHFTPVQALGESGSCYSLLSQDVLSDQLLPAGRDVDALSAAERERAKDDALAAVVGQLEEKHGLLSMCDVVWNHTASNSPWLAEHPEAGYSLDACPHLKVAYELDRALQEYSRRLAHYDDELVEEEDVQRVMHTVKRSVIPQLRLWEYFVVNVDEAVYVFRKALLAAASGDHEGDKAHSIPELAHLPEPARDECDQHTHAPYSETFTECCLYDTGDGERFHRRVRLSCALSMFAPDLDAEPSARSLSRKDVRSRCALYRRALERFNLALYEQYDADVQQITQNLTSTIRYLHVDPLGPQKQAITAESPLVQPYFTEIKAADGRMVPLANSGWVWDADPRVDFASAGKRTYFLRELIVWSDCVKLRYGDGPADNPWLWQHMAAYTAHMAKLFHGLRLDNCHTTSVAVAQYMLDAARAVRPHVYLFAELFTQSAAMDALYFARLGIHALVREAMHASDAKGLCSVVYRSGGLPAGCFSTNVVEAGGFRAPPAMCYDCTHDNETPSQRRTAVDALPNAAAVAMAACAVGSSRGYDELIPRRLDVVAERRLYPIVQRLNGGIYPMRIRLNELHRQLAHDGYNEVHVHEQSGVVAVSRHHPRTHDAITMVCLGAFRSSDVTVNYMLELARNPPAVDLSGEFAATIVSARLFVPQQHYRADAEFITGLSSSLTVREVPEAEYHELFSVTADNKLLLPEPSPGTVVLVRTRPSAACAGHLDALHSLLHAVAAAPVTGGEEGDEEGAGCEMVAGGDSKGDDEGGEGSSKHHHHRHHHRRHKHRHEHKKHGQHHRHHRHHHRSREDGAGQRAAAEAVTSEPLREVVERLSLLHLNVALYRCAAEEEDAIGRGAYGVPGHGALPYCGLVGFHAIAEHVAENNRMGHPFCGNLRDGNWMMDYIVDRLHSYAGRFPHLAAGLTPLAVWLCEAFAHVRMLERYLVPKYFAAVVAAAHGALINRALSLLGPVAQRGVVRDPLPAAARLALGSVQLYGPVPSAALTVPPGDADLGMDAARWWTHACTMAAGLPHFATGYMRSWGRDTFIALRGLFMVTGRQEEALAILLNFAACVRHGLVPNLIGNGHSPRYNARDAAWWFLQSLQDYCAMFEGGACSRQAATFLVKTELHRRFPLDERPREGVPLVPVSLADVVQEIMQRHGTGIHFREWNAGHEIDARMRSEGFDVHVAVDPMSGLVYGGSAHNCGTWMDKMGESERAGNAGTPATPRCGAAVEIAGLVKSAVRWLAALADDLDGPFPYPGVQVEVAGEDGRRTLLTMAYSTWNERLQSSFERVFYVPEDKRADSRHVIDKDRVQRRGIYKDTHGAPGGSDYDLRPNFVVAMAVAPELFTKEFAKRALEIAEEELIAPGGIGMRTLDPKHPRYRPHYTNEDGDDASIAGGFNYHQGPEWVWLYGYFLRAKQQFVWDGEDAEQRYRRTQSSINAHIAHIEQSPWRGLTELTNENGSHCSASCAVQAWSHATLLDALYDAARGVCPALTDAQKQTNAAAASTERAVVDS